MTMQDTGRAQLLLKMMKMFSCRYVISQICQNILKSIPAKIRFGSFGSDA